MTTVKMIKEADKVHSVKFKPLTEDDKKVISAIYIGRPVANTLNRITITIEETK